MKRQHLTQRGVFRSQYKWAKSGFLVLKFTDEYAQPLIYHYAHRFHTEGPNFHEDVHTALENVGYTPSRFLRFRISLGTVVYRLTHRQSA